jgi:hypothetical protein
MKAPFWAVLLVATAVETRASQLPPKVWETCNIAEGKDDNDCVSGDRPRPFQEYLSAGAWVTEPRDGFSGEFRWDLAQSKTKALQAAWREIGMVGSSRIRTVRYSFGAKAIGDVLLAESSRGIFAPLMKWSGEMPGPSVYRFGSAAVLVIAKDFGGNIPMVSTWAWAWTPLGPIRLNVEDAVHEAIQKVAPGHVGYSTGLDWRTLHCVTWTWPDGRYPGKVGVAETVDAWFKLDGTRLVVERVEFQKEGEDKHWP